MVMKSKLGVIYPEHKGTMVFRNVVKYEQRHNAKPHETISSAKPLWEPQISYYRLDICAAYIGHSGIEHEIFDRSHPVVFTIIKYFVQSITQHILVINIKNLATCFGSLKHPQANSQNTIQVHQAIARTRWMYLYCVVCIVYCRIVWKCESNPPFAA
jgi:hypothetical protein